MIDIDVIFETKTSSIVISQPSLYSKRVNLPLNFYGIYMSAQIQR
jgi:hypothetical protein